MNNETTPTIVVLCLICPIYPWYLVLKLTSFSQVDWTAEKITELPRPAASSPVKKFVDIGVL